VQQSLLAIEDARFYEHGGVDFSGLFRAAWANFASGRHAQGASTITMQVARRLYLSSEKTYDRKLREVLLAFKLEQQFSKQRLLEVYMNQIYLGERAYGFAAAASIYFDKSLDQLTPAEAALLAGLPKHRPHSTRRSTRSVPAYASGTSSRACTSLDIWATNSTHPH
jgi:penicillin-binding protein 1A